MKPIHRISEREKEVLVLIASEYTTKEIAHHLYISPHTAISHRQSLLQKLEAKNTAGLMWAAYEKGILILQTNTISKSTNTA